MVADERSRSLLVEHVVEVTHLPAGEAKHLLESCGWNVETAVAIHLAGVQEASDQLLQDDRRPLLDSRGPPPRPRAPAQRGGEEAGILRHASPSDELDAHLRRPFRSPLRELCGQLLRCFAGTFQCFTRSLRWIFSPIFSFLFTGFHGTQSTFSSFFDAHFGTEHPPFFDGSFTAASVSAHREQKMLLVYLHALSSTECDEFCRGPLKDPLVRSLVEENYVLWGELVSRVQSPRLRAFLAPASYPHMSAVVPSSGGGAAPVRILSLEQTREVASVAGFLAEALERRDGLQTHATEEADRHAVDRQLIRQQDDEYREAVAHDARRQREKEQRQTLMTQKAETRRQKKAMREAKVLSRRREGLALEEEERGRTIDATETARIRLTLPDGSRRERQFRASDSVGRLWKWAEYAALETDFPHRAITLTVPYSAVKLECSNNDETFAGLGLHPNAVVLLGFLESSDESSSDGERGAP